MKEVQEKGNMNCKLCSNKNCLVAKHCSPDWIALINKRKRNIRCNKGQNVFLEGSPVMGIYFIYRGKIKITVTGENNNEQIVRMANDSHILGHRGYGGENYPIGATALSDSFICFIDNETLNEVFLANSQFVIGLMMFYSAELRKLESRTKYLSQMTVREKVIYTLVYLKETFGLTKNNTLDIIISRQEIANIVGTTADQISREISALNKENLITIDKKNIILKDNEKLIELIKSYFPYSY